MRKIGWFVILVNVGFAQLPDDQARIQAALERGNSSSAKEIWKDISKHHEARINRAGFGDTIGKKIIVISGEDSIALEAARRRPTGRRQFWKFHL